VYDSIVQDEYENKDKEVAQPSPISKVTWQQFVNSALYYRMTQPKPVHYKPPILLA
jgi:hypothetical protein